MKIDTTINIRDEILLRIDEISVACDVSRSRVVSLLIRHVMNRHKADKNRFSRVKYQQRDPEAEWKRPHIVLEYDLYEKSIDLRKLLKMSVSHIVQVAFNQFIDEIIEKIKRGDGSDNNLRHYICIGKRYGKVFSFTVFWDFPSEEQLIKHLE